MLMGSKKKGREKGRLKGRTGGRVKMWMGKEKKCLYDWKMHEQV